MSRLLPTASVLLASLPALAQEAKEAPMEKADPMFVLLFLILFVGSGVAYAGYLWWRNRKDKQEAGE